MRSSETWFLSVIFVFFASFGLPTIYADNAFYLNVSSIENILSQKYISSIGGITYAGTIEWLLLHLAPSTKCFIVFFKFFILGVNFLFFLMASSLDGRRSCFCFLRVVFIFSAFYLYLSPSYYSLVIAGFSCAYLASYANRLHTSVLFWLLALYFCGFDLPNPKYLGLAYFVYLFASLFYYVAESKKNIHFLYINSLIFIAIISILSWIYFNTGVDVPLNYFTSNEGVLLDLVGRTYFAALLPFKSTREAFYIYSLVIIYLNFFVFSTIRSLYKPSSHFKEHGITQCFKNKNIAILGLLGAAYYFSLGIIEPTGLVSFLVNKYPVLSFYRTRAGFDMVYFFCLFIVYIRLYKYAPVPCLRYEKIFFILMSIMIGISIIQIFPYYYNNVSSLSSQAKILDFFKRINQKTRKGCYAATSPAYIINTIFGMGPPIARLATNFIYIQSGVMSTTQEKEKQYDLLTKIVTHYNYVNKELYERYYKNMQLELNPDCDLIVLDEQDKNAYDVLGSINFKVVDRIFNYVAIRPQYGRTPKGA